MEQEPKVVSMPQSTYQETTENNSRAPMPKKSSRTKIIIIVLAFLFLGTGAFASYYYNTWPFSLLSTNKEAALVMAIAKMQNIESGRYSISVTIGSEARDDDRLSLSELFVDENDQTEEKYNRDNDRLRSLETTLKSLRSIYNKDKSYPPASEITGVLPDGFTYQTLDDGQDFEIKATFELDEAAAAVQRSLRQAAISGKTVTINHASIENIALFNFYFYQAPKPIYEQILLGNSSEFGSLIPADFSLNLSASGLTQKFDDHVNAEFKIGGQLDAGDLIAAFEAEMRKVDDIFYGRINKIPSLFGNYADLKQKWIQVKKEDVVSTAASSPFEFFDKNSNKSQSVNDQIFVLLKEALNDKVLTIDYSLPDQVIQEQEYFVYQIKFNQEKILPFYQKMAAQLKEEYGDDAILKEKDTTIEFLKSDSFTKLMTYLDVNSTFTVAVNKKTGYLSNFKYKLVFVPGGQGNMSEKQLFLITENNLSDINKKVSVDEPKDFITFEDAIILLSGQSREEYRFNKQLENIQAIRTALASYKRYTGEYPDSLDQLTKKRSEIAAEEEPTLKELGLSDDEFGINDLEYSYLGTNMDEQPFISHIPNDIFTEKPLIYSKTEDDFNLIYKIELPPKSENDENDLYNYGVISASQYLSVVSGENTANNQVLSMEMKEALQADDDNDGLPNIVENYYNTDINNSDSDADGFLDGDEVKKGYDPSGPGSLDYSHRWYNSSYTPYPMF